MAYTLVTLAARRRLDPAGVVSVACFGIGVLVFWACGGNTLAIELQDPALTGLFGIACLGSVSIGRPLHLVILRLLGHSNPRYTEIAARVSIRTSMVNTTIIGLAFLGHAAAIAVLALTQPTSLRRPATPGRAALLLPGHRRPVLLPQPPASPPAHRRHPH